MYVEKQFLIMVAKCVSAVIFGSKKPTEEKCPEEEEYRGSWFVMHWLRTSASVMRCLHSLTPRRLDIVHSKCLSDRPSSPAMKLGQMERSDAFTLPTPTNSAHYFVAAATSCCSWQSTNSNSCCSSQSTQHNNRPCWGSASSSASTLTSGAECDNDGSTDTEDPPSSAGCVSGGGADGALDDVASMTCFSVVEDEYVWDEMSSRVDDLLKQELNESDDLEKTVEEAEEHCHTVCQIHDMATRIKVLMDENDRLTHNLIVQNFNNSIETQDSLESD